MNDNESPEDGLPAVQPRYSSPSSHRSNRHLYLIAGVVGVAVVVAAVLFFPRPTGDPKHETTARKQFRDIAERIEAKLGEVAAETEVELDDCSFEVIEEIYDEKREQYPWLGRVDIRWKIPDDAPNDGTTSHTMPALATYRWFEPGRRWEYHDYREGTHSNVEWGLGEQEIERVFRKGFPQAARIRYGYCRVEFLSESEETVEMLGWKDVIVFKHTGAPLIWELQVVRRAAGEDAEETVLASDSNRRSAMNVSPDVRASIEYPGYQGKGIVAIPDIGEGKQRLPLRFLCRSGYSTTPGSSMFNGRSNLWDLPQFGCDGSGGVVRPPSVTLRSGQTETYLTSYHMSDSPRSERKSIDFVLKMTCVDQDEFGEPSEVSD